MNSTAATLANALWWLSLRLMVGALCVGFVLSLAQLTIHGLLAFYLNIAPYPGLS